MIVYILNLFLPIFRFLKLQYSVITLYSGYFTNSSYPLKFSLKIIVITIINSEHFSCFNNTFDYIVDDSKSDNEGDNNLTDIISYPEDDSFNSSSSLFSTDSNEF